jgi:hypothetical protein
MGASYLWGIGGEAGGYAPLGSELLALNRERTEHEMIYAWASYMPGGPVKGWWLRGEWGGYRDRFAPSEVQSGINDNPFWTWTPGVRDPRRFWLDGWYFSTGYKLQDSIWADKLNKWVKPMEFTFRYEAMQNLFFQDLVDPLEKVDLFKTQVYTAGINYYIMGHNAKIQVTYNWVFEETPSNGYRQLREVRNDNFMFNFQVGW